MSISRPTASDFLSSPYDPALEKRFFSRVLLPNGMFKTTDCHRLDDVNDAILPFIEKIREWPLEIMDVGASSGISTQEWSDHLSSRGIEARVIGTDRCCTAFHVRCGFIEGLMDENFNVMHLGVFNRGLPARGRSYQAPILFGLKALVRFLAICGCSVRPLPLVSKAVHTVNLVDDDVEANDEGYRGRFHVIRAANVLSPQYFPAPRIKKMAAALAQRLRREGMLVVGRTDPDGGNHATLFRLAASGLRVEARMGRGSEVEDLLLALELS